MKRATVSSNTPLTPAEYHVLLAVADQERHGYGIMQEITRMTSGGMRLGPGTLYRTIKQLLSGGLIVESGERRDADLDDERRRYYRITELGKRAGAAESRRLAELVRIARTKRLARPDLAAGGAS